MIILKYIATGIITICLGIAGFLGWQSDLGATIPVSVAVFETTLSTKISTTDTSMTLVTGTDKAGNALDGYMCFTLDGGKTNEEFVCGTASSTAVSGLKRGLDPITTASSTALLKEHRAGSSVKITDYPQLAIISRILNGDDTVPNKLTYSSANTFTAGSNQIPSVLYVDTVATSGAPYGNWITAGLLEFATKAEIDAGTATSAAGIYLTIPSTYAYPTTSATSMIPFTNSSGKLSQGFLDLTQSFTFSGGLTSTGLTSLASTTINKTLVVTGTSTFTGLSTFTLAPIISATATAGTEATNLNTVNAELINSIGTYEAVLNATASAHYATTAGIYTWGGLDYAQAGLFKICIGDSQANAGACSILAACYEVGAANESWSLTVPIPKGYWFYPTSTVAGGTPVSFFIPMQ